MAATKSGERKGRRLLVAAIGVATISYASSQGCEPEPTMTTTSGNLLPPPQLDAAPPAPDAAVDASLPTSGNLLPPPPADAGRVKDATVFDGELPTSGNLMPPPPLETR